MYTMITTFFFLSYSLYISDIYILYLLFRKYIKGESDKNIYNL